MTLKSRGLIPLYYESLYGWLSKLWSLFGYGTYYLGYPEIDLNFKNYPYGI